VFYILATVFGYFLIFRCSSYCAGDLDQHQPNNG
jgi:hypothetical protein